MSKTLFKLDHGLKIGESIHFDVELRELTAGDIIDAEEDAEKLVNAGSPSAPNYVLVRSDIRASMAILRRQIRRIGDINGPINEREIRKLHPDDLFIIQRHAEAMDKAIAQAQAMSERGKS